MDIWKRGVMIYGASSVVVPLMAAHLRSIGTDTSANPAWLLIAPLLYGLIASWILLLLGYLIRRSWNAMEQAEKERERVLKAREEAKQATKEKAERRRRWVEAKIEKLEERNKELGQELKEAKRRLADLEKPKEEAFALPEAEFEPEEGSISLALEEFG